MPIYAYKCESCGFAKDVLQKMSDAPLDTCPSCNKQSFKKQVTAAGFQLKGAGWYVTDFKGGNKAPSAPAESADKPASDSAGAPAAPAADAAAPKTAAAPAVAAPAPAAPASGT